MTGSRFSLTIVTLDMAARTVGAGAASLRLRGGATGMTARSHLRSANPAGRPLTDFQEVASMREIRHGEEHDWHRTSVVDEEAIDRERILTYVNATNERIQVRVAQRCDFDLLAEPVTVHISPPRVTVGNCFELTGAQATELAEALVAASRFAARITVQTMSDDRADVVAFEPRQRRPQRAGDA